MEDFIYVLKTYKKKKKSTKQQVNPHLTVHKMIGIIPKKAKGKGSEVRQTVLRG